LREASVHPSDGHHANHVVRIGIISSRCAQWTGDLDFFGEAPIAEVNGGRNNPTAWSGLNGVGKGGVNTRHWRRTTAVPHHAEKQSTDGTLLAQRRKTETEWQDLSTVITEALFGRYYSMSRVCHLWVAFLVAEDASAFAGPAFVMKARKAGKGTASSSASPSSSSKRRRSVESS
jgi:hypothetical protein